jgi:N-acetylmuramoyl-L-alanine amidase
VVNLKKRRVTLFLTFIIVITLLLLSFTVYQNLPQDYICIDAGHGGYDGGATSNNVIEKDITLNASLILGSLLEQTGYHVKYTRTKDVALSGEKTKDMHKRLKIINEDTNILYISIHANIYPKQDVKGAQTFYNNNNDKSKMLGEFIQDYLKLEDKTNKRLSKAIKNKYIVDNAKIPGCIVELGFISNQEDRETLTNEKALEYRMLMIYLGIIKYLEYN